MKSLFSGKSTLITLMLIGVMSILLCGCGAKEVKLTVIDKDVKTEVDAKTNMTVSDVLKDASITLGDKDETDPKLDSTITEDMKEITVKRYAKVTVVLGDEKKEVELVGGKVEDAIKKSGFDAKDADCDKELTAFLDDGMTITLTKGVEVKLTDGDKKASAVKTKAATVADFLKEQKITLGNDDQLSVKPDDKITEGMDIKITRIEFKEVEATEKIDFQTEEKYSDSIDKGSSEVTQNGVEGEKKVKYKVKYVNGKEDSKEKLSEEITKEPVNKIVTYGTRESGNGGGNADNNSGGRSVVSKEAVYDCDGSGHGYYVITYSDGTTEYEEF